MEDTLRALLSKTEEELSESLAAYFAEKFKADKLEKELKLKDQMIEKLNQRIIEIRNSVDTFF